MSLFYANATPMLKTLTDATTKFVSEVSPKWNTPLSTHLRTLIHSSDVHDLKLCWCLFVWQQHSDLPLENTTDCLSTMASVCKVMLETPWVSRCPLLLHSPVLSYCAITNSWDVFSWLSIYCYLSLHSNVSLFVLMHGRIVKHVLTCTDRAWL